MTLDRNIRTELSEGPREDAPLHPLVVVLLRLAPHLLLNLEPVHLLRLGLMARCLLNNMRIMQQQWERIEAQ